MCINFYTIIFSFLLGYIFLGCTVCQVCVRFFFFKEIYKVIILFYLATSSIAFQNCSISLPILNQHFKSFDFLSILASMCGLLFTFPWLPVVVNIFSHTCQTLVHRFKVCVGFSYLLGTELLVFSDLEVFSVDSVHEFFIRYILWC